MATSDRGGEDGVLPGGQGRPLPGDPGGQGGGGRLHLVPGLPQPGLEGLRREDLRPGGEVDVLCFL